jgi:glycolate oxidase iron-sulfur subunit
LINPFDFDAVISNAGGCGSHLRTYGHLLHADSEYAERAAEWSRKLRDIHEYLVQIDFRKPLAASAPASLAPSAAPGAAPAPACATAVTYHESCHLCHGQKVSAQPRAILRSLPGVELQECAEAQWCCGSAGIYTITQPETATRLQERKIGHLLATGAGVVATANPGCHLQLQNGLRAASALSERRPPRVAHPIVLLAEAYQAEKAI